ncbi:thiopeptide-type bacteriocin biosynthesis protein [Spirosoma lacussanchae]
MSSRCTPFGLFAGVSMATVGEETVGYVEGDNWQTTIRPDMAWLSALVDQLVSQLEIRRELRYSVNNSLYTLGQQFRYSDYTIESGQRAFYINSVERDDLIQSVLAFVQNQQDGVRGHDIVTFLIEQAGERDEDAQGLVDELIDAHLLISELEPNVTGNNAFGQLLRRLGNIPSAQFWKSQLSTIQEQLQAGSLTTIAAQHTENRMRALVGEGYADKSLMQVDLIRPTETIRLKQSVVQQIGQELLELAPLRPDSQSTSLKAFSRRLYDRHGTASVPLLHVLDHETGVGYGETEPRVGQLSLLNGLTQPPASPLPQPDRLDALRLEKLTVLLTTGEQVQAITEDDLAKVASSAPQLPLAQSWAVLGELYGNGSQAIDTGQYTFLVKSVAGPSGASLMARFGDHHTGLADQLRHLTDWEANQYPDALLAEIVHLPAGRVGNVLSRPRLRSYEIPYVTPASVESDYAITLSDLWVRSMDGRTVELWSKKRDCKVIPRNTTAHNYHQSDDVYRFLTDLSHQQESFSLRWSWGSLSGQSRLPRLMYKHLVLARAQWTLMHQTNWSSTKEMVADLQNRLSLPHLIAVIEGDHELLLDLNSPPCQELLLAELRKRRNVQVVEWLGSPDQCWIDRTGQRYTAELVIPFATPQAPSLPLPRPSPFAGQRELVRRTFGPGSEWLYVKVYVGELTANDVLMQVVKPLVEQAMVEGWIDHWFFIRYYDPEPHLRLRFHGSEATYHLVLNELVEQLASWQAEGLVQSVVVDTYQRELERYGHQTMPLIERLFWQDSIWNLHWIEQNTLLDEDMLWWVACEQADQFMDAFGFPFAEKQSFMVGLQLRFQLENPPSQTLRKEFNVRYRAWQERIDGRTLPNLQLEENWRVLIDQIRGAYEQPNEALPPLSELVQSLGGCPHSYEMFHQTGFASSFKS